MKITITLSLLLCHVFLFAQNLNPYVASERLQEAVADEPNAFHRVVFLLTDRVDAAALNADFTARNLTLEQRNVELLTALQSKAAQTQPAYISRLESSPQAKNVSAYWISNLIYAEVKKDLLVELSRDAGIDQIDLNADLLLEEADCTAPVPPAPDGTEAGLLVIDADLMWDMGYTGYGRLALTSDTGVDGIHPALIANFRGNITDGENAWLNLNGSSAPEDCDDHGTHVTGTMVGLDRVTNDTIGVAFNAQWMGSPSIVCSFNGSQDNINTFQWALDPDGDPATIDDMPDVVNNSWRDPSSSACNTFYNDVFDALEATKVAVVFSAGNEGPDAMTITNPKNINTSLVNAFAVGATSSGGSNPIADFSSRGPSVCGGEGSLAIKPEVSAPGVSVRSCVPGEGYGNKGGTSMAAPHVSGAILLLREAFPNTTATEVKSALYFSAVDLGEAGEDNTYGMGMINVPAAFAYLVEQGHTPVAPAARDTDVIAANLQIGAAVCPGNFRFTVTFENNGNAPLTSLDIDYNIGGMVGSAAWTGELAPQQTTIVTVEESNLPFGETAVTVVLNNPNGTTDDRPLNNSIRREVEIIDAEPIVAYAEGEAATYCSENEVLLRVETPDFGDLAVEWFDQPFGGDDIGEGKTLTVGPLSESQTFYAEAKQLLPAGKAFPQTALAVSEQDSVGFRFDALTDIRINSFLVYFDNPGLVRFRVYDPSGELIDSAIKQMSGESPTRIRVLLDVPQGNNYRLWVGPSSPILSEVEGGGAYPYLIENVIRVERSLTNVFADGVVEYHGLYDWEIEIPEVCGRVAVPVEVVEGGTDLVAQFTPSTNEADLTTGADISFAANTADADSFLWNFGDGTTDSQNADPTHTFTETGTYEVSLTLFDAEGCSNSYVEEIEVTRSIVSSTDDFAFSDVELGIFPNPTRSQIQVEMQSTELDRMSLTVNDIYGKTVSALQIVNGTNTVDLSALQSGIYFFVFTEGKQRTVRKVVKL